MRDAATTHRLLLFARHDLVDPGRAPHGPALLLEGSWPDETSPERRRSLDDEIDARFPWIDRAASRLAEQLAEPLFLPDAEHGDLPGINAAWLNALALRYYLVKLIRLVAYFTEIRPLAACDHVRLVALQPT